MAHCVDSETYPCEVFQTSVEVAPVFMTIGPYQATGSLRAAHLTEARTEYRKNSHTAIAIITFALGLGLIVSSYAQSYKPKADKQENTIAAFFREGTYG